MQTNKSKGKCKICNKYCNLTYEHIPPNKAFNKTSSKVIQGDQILNSHTDKNKKPWDFSGAKYTQQQRGMGTYSLCASCNNLTGSLYATEYVKFAHGIAKLYYENKISKTNQVILFSSKAFYPLRFAKQVLSMFCSIHEGLTKSYPEIKDLILDKNKKGVNDKKFKLGMYLIVKNRIAYGGLSAMLISGVGSRLISYIDAYPFGFTLDIDPNPAINYVELDITSFLNDYDYDQSVDFEFGLPIYERNVMFAADYRTKEEIEKCAKENSKLV